MERKNSLIQHHDFLQTHQSSLHLKKLNGLILSRVLDDMLQVNLNITLPHLPCKFASVDITDVTHTRRLNVTKNVRKWITAKDGQVRLDEVGEQTERQGGHEQLPDDHPIRSCRSSQSQTYL